MLASMIISEEQNIQHGVCQLPPLVQQPQCILLSSTLMMLSLRQHWSHQAVREVTWPASIACLPDMFPKTSDLFISEAMTDTQIPFITKEYGNENVLGLRKMPFNIINLRSLETILQNRFRNFNISLIIKS